MAGQNYYSPAAPTSPAGGEYSNPPPAYAPTTTPAIYGYNYPSNGFDTSTMTAPATKVFGDGSNDEWGSPTSCLARDQAAIIALGVICGILAIGLAALLFLIFSRRHQEQKRTEGKLVIGPRYQGRHNHRRDRTEHSRGTTDDMTDYLYPSPKHRSQRRSQPVTQQEFEGLQKPAMAAQWGNAGSPAAYAQFTNAGAPVYFQAGQGAGQAVPVVPMPAPAQQSRIGLDEVMSGAEQSEVSSRGESKVPRNSSVRRHHSRASSSQGGRSGRR